MMNYEAIAQKVQETIGNVEATVSKVTKNNITLTGITVLRRGGNIAPTIYIPDHLKDKDEDCIVDYVVETYNQNSNMEGLDSSAITSAITTYDPSTIWLSLTSDEEYARSNSGVYSVYKAEGSDTPLYIIPRIMFSFDESGSASTKVNTMMLNEWNKTLSEVIEAGFDNMLKTAQVDNLINKLLSLHEMNSEDETEDIREVTDAVRENQMDDVMCVITCDNGLPAAALLGSKEFMERVANKTIGDSFYVLPSSIYELIVAKGEFSTDTTAMFAEMVSSVNSTSVSAEDFLSNDVYYYDAEKGVMLNALTETEMAFIA